MRHNSSFGKILKGAIIMDENMNEVLWYLLKEHYGHRVEIAMYGDANNPSNITLEDMDTNEVILDAEIYTICARED